MGGGGGGGGLRIPGLGAKGGIGIVVVVLLCLAGFLCTGQGGLGGLGNIGGLGGLSSNDSTTADNTQINESCDRSNPDRFKNSACVNLAFINSIQAYWQRALPENFGVPYQTATTRYFSGQVNTACGAADAGVGPFYCPGDNHVYIDLTFYRPARPASSGRRGSSRRRTSWPTSTATTSDAARHRGADAPGPAARPAQRQRVLGDARTAGRLLRGRLGEQRASSTTDAGGAPIFTSLTDAGHQRGAWTAAAAVGDDTIQKKSTGRVNEAAFTHGSAGPAPAVVRPGLPHRRPAPVQHVRQQPLGRRGGRRHRRGRRRERVPAHPPGAAVDGDPQVVRHAWCRPGRAARRSPWRRASPVGSTLSIAELVTAGRPPMPATKSSRSTRPRVSLQSWSYAPAMLPAASRVRNASAASRAPCPGACPRSRKKPPTRAPATSSTGRQRAGPPQRLAQVVDRSCGPRGRVPAGSAAPSGSRTRIDTARAAAIASTSTACRGSGTSSSRSARSGSSGASRRSASIASTARRSPPQTRAVEAPASGSRIRTARSAASRAAALRLVVPAPREPVLRPAAGGRAALHVGAVHLGRDAARGRRPRRPRPRLAGQQQPDPPRALGGLDEVGEVGGERRAGRRVQRRRWRRRTRRAARRRRCGRWA